MGKISNTVLTSRDQGLTGGQQKNARDNIGAMGRLSTWTDGDVVVSGENGEVVDSGVKLSAKADKTYVDEKVALKADKTYVDEKVAPKADKSYVDGKLATKAEKTYVDAELVKKADKTYVDTELNKKAEKTYVDAQLSTKIDKVAGKGLSTNDYTNADMQKLADIGNFPAASGGTRESLVTTGDKWAWNHKLDDTTYYLSGAVVTDVGNVHTLTISDSDGNPIVFTITDAEAAISTISMEGESQSLPIDANKNVEIPLAASSIPGQYGKPGLVKGIYEEFQQ